MLIPSDTHTHKLSRHHTNTPHTYNNWNMGTCIHIHTYTLPSLDMCVCVCVCVCVCMCVCILFRDWWCTGLWGFHGYPLWRELGWLNSWGSPFNRCSLLTPACALSNWLLALSAFYHHQCLVTVLSQVHCNKVESSKALALPWKEVLKTLTSVCGLPWRSLRLSRV